VVLNNEEVYNVAIAALFVAANWIPTVQATADGRDFYLSFVTAPFS
jgi:hypothetical protein